MSRITEKLKAGTIAAYLDLEERLKAKMFEAGMLVRAEAAYFEGIILVPVSGTRFDYYTDGSRSNIPVWAVQNLTTHEVRFFLASALVAISADDGLKYEV